ncbi:putative 22K protein [Pyrrhocoris apterus virus 1]|nr:putative 22K protein [Pyrrhocoris apterus virus 1]
MVDFFPDFINAYAKIFTNPAIIVLYIACVVQMIEMEQKISPTLFQHLIDITDDASKEADALPIAAALAKAIVWILKLIDKYKTQIIPQVFVWIPYYMRETSSNLYFTLMFAIVSLIYSSWSILQTFLYGQVWYLFTEMEGKWNKVLVGTFAILTFIYEPFGFHQDSAIHSAFSSMILQLPTLNYSSYRRSVT